MEYVNPVLLLAVVSEICLGICAWRSPRFLRRVSAHLLARADVIEISERERSSRKEYWLAKLNVDEDRGSARPPFAADSLSRSGIKAS
jgi:hypothetical protein